ncbi:acyl-CoA dehydrogenase family protein [Frankia sp. EI5c]|uniref:acyl-CoA dehydrogenase family protein n=1 Tax=Frankia sp. EI5c TaxID=683316 RepID=UPI0007C2FAB4|nr:acyl-CoA dehydrogenase family protein [Frankia sp. EI5c]OAA29651.1 acyl-CoA dehydrogenase family protein [Frankia sp. EI5c]
MDVRLTTEQRELRNAAARLADDLGPGSVLDLDDAERVERLEKAVAATGWRSLRSDGASGVEVALVVEELARGLVDVPFLGPVLADDLRAKLGEGSDPAALAVGDEAVDARGLPSALGLRGTTVGTVAVGEPVFGVDLTRTTAAVTGPFEPVGEIPAGEAQRWHALALTVTTADILGAARGAHALACEYAKVRSQYGRTIGSFQAIAHLLAESLALIEGSISVLRYAAWAVDELDPAEALRAGQVAKVYTARAAQTICETAVQVHGGIGNTWECLAHVFLRRALASGALYPVSLEEIDLGLS